jgi:hypothetical protein
MTAEEWVRAYAMLVLRLDLRLTEGGGGLYLDYLGPPEWREEASAEEPPPVGRLIADAEELLGDLPFEPPRATYLAAHARALRALARREDGVVVPLPELVRECLGLEVAAVPESVFEQAHTQLDRALPRTGGSIVERHHAWRVAHSLPVDQLWRLPELVGRAIAECRARTQAMITPLPADEQVDCELEPGVSYIAAAWHRGGTRSTVLINGDRPFNLAALLYVVAHEGHPGHIAEQVLKEINLARRGHPEQRVRFLPSPPFALSEGLGLHAQDLIFPDDQAQAWLTDNILTEQGIRPDGSDFAAIHHARNVLFGAQANAALLAADGRPEAEVADYLVRWALLDEHQLGPAVKQFATPGGHPYIFAYYHGWRLLLAWLNHTSDGVRRLLTEQLLPADLH